MRALCLSGTRVQNRCLRFWGFIHRLANLANARFDVDTVRKGQTYSGQDEWKRKIWIPGFIFGVEDGYLPTNYTCYGTLF